MFEHRYGIKLKKTTADAAVLKLLRKSFPTLSFSELGIKVQTHDYVFLSDMDKDPYDGKHRMAKLLREFDKEGIETELFPLLLFIGIGAMIDFGPLLSNPKLLLCGAAAQFGIFFTLSMALSSALPTSVQRSMGLTPASTVPSATVVRWMSCFWQ